jgi:hypothetical protein
MVRQLEAPNDISEGPQIGGACGRSGSGAAEVHKWNPPIAAAPRGGHIELDAGRLTFQGKLLIPWSNNGKVLSDD